MRILLIVVYYLPSTTSSAKLIYDLAEELVVKGHEVIVLTTSDSLLQPSEVSSSFGIKVLRIKTGRIEKAPKIVRAFNEMMLTYTMWRRGKKFFYSNRCDLIVWYSPSIFFGALVKKLKNIYKCPSYLILRDIFPQWAVDLGVLRKGFVYRFFRKKELEQYDAADIIGVQSPSNLEYFKRNFLDKKYHLECLFNWAKTKEAGIPFNNYREKFGLKDKLVFFYGGNIGLAQDVGSILRLAERLLHEPDVYFLIVGDGSEAKRLKDIIIKRNLKNIIIKGPVDQTSYLSMLSEFDIGLITLNQKFKTQNLPGKMLGYMYFSMPILASINGGNDLKSILEQNDCGLVNINGDIDLFYSNALTLIRDGSLRSKMGKNARMLLERTFSVERAAEQILSHFQT